MATKFVKNAVGRMIPEEINGKPVIPFQGVHKYITEGKRYAPPLPSSANYPSDGNKRVADLKTALKNAGIKSGIPFPPFVCQNTLQYITQFALMLQ